jgi:hypothetical protein
MLSALKTDQAFAEEAREHMVALIPVPEPVPSAAE